MDAHRRDAPSRFRPHDRDAYPGAGEAHTRPHQAGFAGRITRKGEVAAVEQELRCRRAGTRVRGTAEIERLDALRAVTLQVTQSQHALLAGPNELIPVDAIGVAAEVGAKDVAALGHQGHIAAVVLTDGDGPILDAVPVEGDTSRGIPRRGLGCGCIVAVLLGEEGATHAEGEGAFQPGPGPLPQALQTVLAPDARQIAVSVAAGEG